MELLKRFFVEEKAQGMTEYALILGLIVLGVWVAVTATGLGDGITSLFERVTATVGGCVEGDCGG